MIFRTSFTGDQSEKEHFQDQVDHIYVLGITCLLYLHASKRSLFIQRQNAWRNLHLLLRPSNKHFLYVQNLISHRKGLFPLQSVEEEQEQHVSLS